jgi:hypothetical protein
MSRALPLVLAAVITAGTAGAALLPESAPAAAGPTVAAQVDTLITPVQLDWTAAGMYAGRAAAAKKAAELRAAQAHAAQVAADARARQARIELAQRRASRARRLALTSGDPRSIARAQLAARGWSGQFSCLDSLWTRESNWRVYASNPSGAYGIPQSLPGSKMASAGADWRTNPATQIRWGLGYIASTYGSPCAAWRHSQSHNWY